MDSSLNKTQVKNDINSWFEGTYIDNSPLHKLLDSYDPKLTVPIWWAGFNMRDEPIAQKFREVNKENNRYSDSDTYMKQLSDEYHRAQDVCQSNEDSAYIGNFESVLSSYYTENSLNKLKTTHKSHLKLIVLLNKNTSYDAPDGDIRLLENSYFYTVELISIVKYCYTHNLTCTIYIYNLKSNCGCVKKALDLRVENIKTELLLSGISRISRIKFICFKDDSYDNKLVKHDKNT